MINCCNNNMWSYGRLVGLVVLGGLTGLAGCGGGVEANPKLPRVAASGKVDFDGTPIPAGSLVFYHVASGTPGTAEITDGTYSVGDDEGPVVGENSVAISGFDKPEGSPLWEGKWSKTVNVEASGFQGDFSVKKDEIIAPAVPEPSRIDN